MGIVDKVCKVAIIGAGNMALEHIKAFKDIAGVEVVGIQSRTKERAEKLANEYDIPLVCRSIEELYKETKANLVVVTVFETAMLEVALKCLDFDWQILLEKPPGYNLEQVLQIHKKANKNNKQVLVALNRRCLSSSLRVLEELGKESKRFVHVQDQQSLDTARFYKHPDEVIRYWMYANSIHLIDYFSYFCRGEVIEVKPLHEWNPEKTFVLLAQVRFSSGDEGLYQAVWSGPGPWAVTVQTTTDRWEIKPLEQVAHQKLGERQLTRYDTHEWDVKFKPGFRNQAQKAIDFCRDQDTSRVTTLNEALQTMQIINMIYRV